MFFNTQQVSQGGSLTGLASRSWHSESLGSSPRLPECPQSTAAGFPQSEQSKESVKKLQCLSRLHLRRHTSSLLWYSWITPFWTALIHCERGLEKGVNTRRGVTEGYLSHINWPGMFPAHGLHNYSFLLLQVFLSQISYGQIARFLYILYPNTFQQGWPWLLF